MAVKEAYEIVEETYEEIKKEIEERKRKAEAERKRYYTPFAIGQEVDEVTARGGQIDMLEQTVLTWITAPHRIFIFMQMHA